jgi:hypothetical protein
MVAGTMRLGAMLVRDGRLTPAQVLAAVGQQARTGGRLGTVLVEMRLVDTDTLTVYLGLEMGIPIATRAALERAKRTALRLLTPDQAIRFFCVPLIIQDQQLITAMRDPHDFLVLDELAHTTGYRIIPRVAPEVRLWYYLDRYYGVPRPPRFRALGDLALGGPPGGANAIEPPPPPLPGLPPLITPAPSGPLGLATVTPLHDDGQDGHDELATQLERAPDEPHPPGRVVDVQAMARAAVSPLPGASSPLVPPLPIPDTLDLDAALLRVGIATTRSEIANAFLGFARGALDAGVLLIVREDLAFGWKGFGPDVSPDRVETLLVPLETSSMFRAAIDAADVFATSPPASSLHLHLLKVLRAPVPERAVVAPVLIRHRVVNLLYGQVHDGRVLDDSAIEGLRRLAIAAGNAYVRLIALHKHAG